MFVLDVSAWNLASASWFLATLFPLKHLLVVAILRRTLIRPWVSNEAPHEWRRYKTDRLASNPNCTSLVWPSQFEPFSPDCCSVVVPSYFYQPASRAKNSHRSIALDEEESQRVFVPKFIFLIITNLPVPHCFSSVALIPSTSSRSKRLSSQTYDHLISNSTYHSLPRLVPPLILPN